MRGCLQHVAKILISLSCMFLCGEWVFAHPVPKDNHDRIIAVKLTPAAVVVKYHLDVDESRAELELARAELPPKDFAKLTNGQAIRSAYTRYCAPLVGGNLIARIDGKPLAFRCVKQEFEVSDHLRCKYTFSASWKPIPDGPHKFEFREGNYEEEDRDYLELSLSADAGMILQNTIAPEKAVIERPPLERRPGDSERLRKISTTFHIAENAERNNPIASEVQTESVTADNGENSPNKLLHLLLDTRRGLVVLLLLATGFGAVHALTPGHGKTLVAAYLVGEHGTVWHALILGLMTTLTHTGAVFVLAIVFLISPTAANLIYYVQGLVGGLFIAGLGIWLLLTRLSGRADHFHLGGHSHHHHHNHAHEHVHMPIVPSGTSVRWWHLVLLGMRGGLVPCWDAIILLSLAISAQRLWLGVPLLLAFSMGLAGVLVALGVGVVWARTWAVMRWGEGPRVQKIVRALPLVSAAFITVLGLWLCYESLHTEVPPSIASPQRKQG